MSVNVVPLSVGEDACPLSYFISSASFVEEGRSVTVPPPRTDGGGSIPSCPPHFLTFVV